MKRTLIVVVAMAALAGVGAAIYIRQGPRPTSAAALERSAVVEVGTIEVWISGTGEIEPEALASLSFGVTGIVGSAPVQVGDRVRAGDVLLELDPRSLDPGLIGAQADLIAAKQQREALLEPASAQQLAQAQLAVVQAQQALEDADRRLRNVKTPGISGAEDRLREAQFGYDNAQANLQLATVSPQASALHAAENSKNLAYSQLQTAQSQFDECVKIACAQRPIHEAALTAAQNGYQSALDAFLTAQLQYETMLSGQQKSAEDAAEQLQKAQDNLAAVQAGPDSLDVAMAEAQLAVAQANLEQAQKTLDDLRAGPDPDDVEAAEVRVRAAQARVEQSRLVAPFDGTVMSLAHRPGDTAAPGRVAVVVAALDRLHVVTTVDELDIVSVSPGQPVSVTLDALPDLEMSGEVAGIDLSPSTSGTAATGYRVRVDLLTSEPSARIGMTAALKVLVARKEDVLLVPNWALRLDEDSGEVYVNVLSDGVVSRRPLTLGLRNDTHSEVLDGLQAGETIGLPPAVETPRRGGFFGGPG